MTAKKNPPPRVEWNDKPRVIIIEAALLAELRKR